jgi:hypothetical protein
LPVLHKHPSELKAHWHATASDLGAILPQSGGEYRADFEYAAATLVCSCFPGETALRLGGLAVPVVPLIQTTPDDPPLHWLGWHEEWGDPVKARRHLLQFGASAITVYYGKPETAKRQLLRAEWTGVLGEDGDRDIFQSPGAAHPHWHVDGIRGYFNELQRQVADLKDKDLATDKVREFGRDETSKMSLACSRHRRLPSPAELNFAGPVFTWRLTQDGPNTPGLALLGRTMCMRQAQLTFFPYVGG